MAKEKPDKLMDLRLRFISDATECNALPLDDRFAKRLDITLRPSFFAGRDTIPFYPGMVRLPEGGAQDGQHRTPAYREDHRARRRRGKRDHGPGRRGCGLVALPVGRQAALSLQLLRLERYAVMAAGALAPGEHEVRIEFTPDAPTPGAPARVTLFVDGQQADETHIKRQAPQRCGTETMDVGID